MPTSPSSSAQAARAAVGTRLRDLRLDAGLTITELASRCGWHHSKTSRIENARSSPTTPDIRVWCRACGVEDQAPDIIAASRNAESLYVEWRRTMRTGLRHLQQSYADLFDRTTLFRVYSARIVPGLVQTEGYAAALLGGVARFHEAPDDVSEAAAARVERSRIIHRPGRRRFLLLIEEAVLRYQLADADAMAAQLGHLLSVGTLPAVSLGVIPAGLPERSIRPLEAFHIYDELVAVELLTARVTVTQPSEVVLYQKAFDELRELAVYGSEARTLIVRAIEALGR
ncbi:helix-turn-helix domain-containing protein [Streptomyces radicis]|uniref:XRE family transcriptional regulator n=1 Tax=Streptomyces radicis TaxID=1750517 RepID=A0A3A9WGR7_9ACTN|nr:helix-turn-helix transcriptional regulator [Streptomyces radicis]RKN11503.1 XRE family transcriptional regulator [Streptomyces radicis]RKN26478.1 XRE family transcriptional regulator [Streptomyces radicis]